MAYYTDHLISATPLDTWRRLFQWNPRHFWGMAGTGKSRVTAKCQGLVREYGWQDQGAVARSGLRTALAEAETKLAQHLGFSPVPRYTEATVPYPRIGDLRLGRIGPYGPDGQRLPLQLPEGEIQALGVPVRTSIGDVPLVGPFPYAGPSPTAPYLIYRDRDGDGYVDQFEIGIATTTTRPEDVALYVAESDRWDGSPLSERWRIQPAHTTIASGVATITGPAWVMVRPVLYEGEDGAPLNGLDPQSQATYLTSAHVATRTTDAAGTTLDTAAAVLTWAPAHCPAWCGPGRSIVACGTIRDAANGIVSVTQVCHPDYGWCTPDWAGWGCVAPTQATVRYLGGLATHHDGTPVAPWAEIICRLAVADLGQPVCSCQDANKLVDYWQRDLSQTGSRDDLYQTPGDATNPFGARWGHIYAWRQVVDQRRHDAIAQ